MTGSKPLTFHDGHLVDLEGGLVPHESDQDAERDGDLGRRDGDDEDGEDLPAEVVIVLC